MSYYIDLRVDFSFLLLSSQIIFAPRALLYTKKLLKFILLFQFCSCPQCSAPRKRYAKKVGDKWGVTNDGGDFPIYFLTFAGLAATVYFSLVVVPTL